MSAPAPVYLTAAQVKARYGGCSDMWLHRRLLRDNFPKPIRLGDGGPRTRRLWKLAELEAWELERIKQSTAA